ncbi:hypothetical protein B0T18DRAFT_394974 [Schizothecium vesticola]|uniref:NAD(P)-binding protein n=1 Tax=Schizothecium vesticola TaxID=314040 RepID=A0AA40EHS6_9PEZI|nr:hypothetical protein B0T18DRAFT_394974 [Schizothecium vesticola]
MPPYPSILASNALLTSTSKRPLVAVLVGATSGIGRLTLHALVATGAPSRIYLIGRPSSAAATASFLAELRALNAHADIIWTEGEVSLLAEVRRICDAIKAKEDVVDLLLLTAGYAPFGKRRDTAEGMEVAGVLEYYGRVLFAGLLAGCLRRAEAGRVVSVLGGGLERLGAVEDVEDLGMRKEGAWSGFRAQKQYTMMNTLGFERLAEGEPGVAFVHAWPGLVSTGNLRRGHEEGSVAAWLTWAVEPLLGALGTKGEGDCTPNAKMMAKVRETGVQDKVWEHTQEVLKPYM